jgi:hypothetical protein
MLMHEGNFLSIKELSNISGLSYEQVKLIISRAWLSGFVWRYENLRHENGFNKGMKVYKTKYKIKKTDSWIGLHERYKIAMEQRRGLL